MASISRLKSFSNYIFTMGIKYSDFVDYRKLDSLKKMALEIFEPTLKYPERLGLRLLPESLGQTAPIFEPVGIKDSDFLIVGPNVEGLGTKNLVADCMYSEIVEKKRIAENLDVKKLYRCIGQDTAAMSVNDVLAVGADPYVYCDIIACGKASWFDDLERTRELLLGYRQAADIGQFAIPQGETPELPGIVNSETLDLAGASCGLVRPKSRYITGEKIEEGDIIYGLASSGIHANGLSKARKIAEKLPEGFFTELSNGKTLGEELLTPTHIYSRLVMELFEFIDIHFLQPITGHGWKKIMRARKPFTYVIENVPEPPLIFQELIEFGKKYGFDVSDFENYQVWNMGVGYIIIGPKFDVDAIRKVVRRKSNIEVYELGYVKKGEKQVIIKPKNIVYKD
ncbi:MAG: AIR synthase-related protein [Candidatus Aenigmatarchaeota archaeon]